MTRGGNEGWWPTWIISERVMAAFTVVIAVVSFFQWCVFSKQLDEMRIDQRAWLSVKPVWETPQINGNVSAPTIVNNVGKTAAKNVRGWVFIQRVSKDTGIDFNNPTYTETPAARTGDPAPAYSTFQVGVMFPNDATTLREVVMGERTVSRISPAPTTWTQTLQEQYRKGDFYFVIRARFTYDDAAGNQHWTQYCQIMQATGRASSTPEATSTECMKWNAVDDNK